MCRAQLGRLLNFPNGERCEGLVGRRRPWSCLVGLVSLRAICYKPHIFSWAIPVNINSPAFSTKPKPPSPSKEKKKNPPFSWPFHTPPLLGLLGDDLFACTPLRLEAPKSPSCPGRFSGLSIYVYAWNCKLGDIFIL